jgi:hypothetical protein
MDVEKNILETSQEEMVMVVGTGTENIGTWRILEGEPEGTWRKGRTQER